MWSSEPPWFAACQTVATSTCLHSCAMHSGLIEPQQTLSRAVWRLPAWRAWALLMRDGLLRLFVDLQGRGTDRHVAEEDAGSRGMVSSRPLLGTSVGMEGEGGEGDL